MSDNGKTMPDAPSGVTLPPLKVPLVGEKPGSQAQGQQEEVEGIPGSPLGQLFRVKLRPDDADLLIYAIIGLERPVDMEQFLSLLKEKILSLPRFSSTMVWRRGRYEWVPVKVTLEDLVQEVELPAGSKREDNDPAMDFANHLLSKPMAEGGPLWEVYVLRNATERGDSLLFRLHHSLGDGVSLASLLLDIISTKDGLVPAFPLRRYSAPANFVEATRRALAFLWNTIGCIFRILRLLFIQDPIVGIKVRESVRHLPREVGGMQLSMDDIKAIASVIDATVNDVFVTVVAAAMDKFMKREATSRVHLRQQTNGHHNPQPQPEFVLRENAVEPMYRPHGLVLVNLRPPLSSSEIQKMREGEQNPKWGSILGYFATRLPVNHVQNPLTRLALVKSAMDRAKNSLEAVMANVGMITVGALAGAKTLLKCLTHLGNHSTTIISNVAGPKDEILLLGNPIKSIQQVLPSSSLGCSFHVITYVGCAFFCFTVDAATASANVISECLRDAFEDLKIAAAAAQATPY